ncbi:MAG: ATP-dependent DNA helicase RecG [Bacilli bacterium]|nr:ATP-dependent DNA helicase RecG [Bacilli bacterium]
MCEDLKKLKIAQNRIELLNQMHIFTVDDLLKHYPYRYEIIEETKPDEHSDKIIIEGKVIDNCKVFFKGKMSRMSFSIESQDEVYNVTIFNRHFLRSHLMIGTVVTIIGKCRNNRITASDIKLKPLNEMSGIVPVYSLKDITTKSFQGYVLKALKYKNNQILDTVPEELRIKHNLIHKELALKNVHFPKNKEDIKHGLRYLKYEEFLRFQLTMQFVKSQRMKETGISKTFDVKRLNQLIASLPFKLTEDQQTAVKDIIKDLRSPHMMYRFLQGDVGSGKTVVSAIGLYASYLAGYQSALMAPTEILARQHYETLKNIYKDTDVSLALLTGSLSLKEKEELYDKILNQDIDIVIGTHALFQNKVKYKKLGFVITDEQHRFGVEQRKALKDKGKQVDFLIMSATPIPRTLAISMYGDMEVSTIHTKPKGRVKTITRYINTTSMKPILSHLKEYLSQGGQCYVICPLVDESENMNAKNASQIASAMHDYFKDYYHVGLLHGQMKDEEKDKVMNDFASNKIQILVSTTVVEVGVDVKNANMMVIYNAERFGMSQLHQLRGRVGRGNVQSYCYLLSDATNEEAIDRLKHLEESDDGFEISYYDLKMRGPGEILGQRQSGLPTFVIADVFKDYDLLEIARDDAILMIERYSQDGSYKTIIENIKKELQSHNEYID